MADITIDASVGASHAPRMGGRSVVWASELIGYNFYVDSNSDFVYSKTTDGGATWGAAVTVDTNPSSGVNGFAVWYDQWTSGNSGSLILLVWTAVTAAANFYVSTKTLDTSSDTLSSILTLVSSATPGSAPFYCSCVTTRAGNSYIGYCDSSSQSAVRKSTNHFQINNTAATTVFESSAGDPVVFIPGNYADPDDFDCLFDDVSADALTLKTYDASANTWSESATLLTITEGTLAQGNVMSGAVRWSDGHLICAVMTGARDNAANDLSIIDINGAGSITNKTDVFSNADDTWGCVISIDQNTDELYVAYNGKSDGSETLGTTTNIYYKKSSDGGATWGAETLLSDSGGPLIGPFADHGSMAFMWEPSWYQDTNDDLMTNFAHAVSITPPATAVPARIITVMQAVQRASVR